MGVNRYITIFAFCYLYSMINSAPVNKIVKRNSEYEYYSDSNEYFEAVEEFKEIDCDQIKELPLKVQEIFYEFKANLKLKFKNKIDFSTSKIQIEWSPNTYCQVMILYNPKTEEIKFDLKF